MELFGMVMMNKIFKVVWSVSHSCAVVVSELAKRCGASVETNSSARIESGTHKFNISRIAQSIIGAVLATHSIYAFAADYVLPDYLPSTNANGAGQLVVGDGENMNIITGTKGYGSIASGASGFKTMTIQQAMDNGYISSGSENINLTQTTLGGRTHSIQYVDPITGASRTVQVYDSDNFASTSVGDLTTYLGVSVGDGQYVNMKLATVTSGGTLDVNVGSTESGWASNSANIFNAVTKVSGVYNVESSASDTKDAVLNYNAKTIVQSGNVGNVAKNTGKDYNFDTATYNGTFSSALGEYTVNNLDDLKNYNDALVKAVEAGQLSPTDYEAELHKAYTTEQKNIHFDTNIPDGDAVLQAANRDVNSFIKASGARSVVNISADANIQAVFSDTSVVTLTDGATLNNNGTLGVAAGAAGGDYVVSARDSIVNNNGIIDAGTSLDVKNAWVGAHTGILATGTTKVQNDGVINLASHQDIYNAYGVLMNDTATFINNGVMNIATGGEPAKSADGVYTYGVFVQRNAVATNNGTLYIGRTAQAVKDEATSDVQVTLPAIGMFVKSGTINNTGNITIGEKVENAVAIQANGSASPGAINVTQDGVIDINGIGSAQNIGLMGINGAKGLVNSGTINLNGYSASGIELQGGSQALHSGTINITNGSTTDNTLKNIGAWVEGTGSQLTMSGSVNLAADNAIGLHVRDGGVIDITDTGKVSFTSGKNQIGYFIYGEGSKVNASSTNTQDVSTEGSTLYRIEGGATFDGSGSSGTTMMASGTDSTILQVTGTGSHFDSGSQSLSITGDGATGIRVEGGADGVITKDAVIVKLSGKDTTAGIVDGNYYDLSGNVDENQKGDSTLTSYATLNTSNTADGAFGYIARNGGTLNHKGSIDFDQAGSTGVLVSGGSLNNDGDIKVNGVAVSIEGADSVVNNNATVTATDGTAAYLVGNDASLSLTGSGETKASGDAHGILLAAGAKGLLVDGAIITMDSTGKGSAIENVANIAGIQLKDTTISVGNGIGIHTGASLAQTNSGTINVTGSGTGILFENIDGSETNQTLDMSDSRDLVINVEQAAGKGIVTNASTDLKTGVSVNVLDANGGEALIVGGTTKNVEQAGELTSKSTSHAVVNVDNGSLETFINKGVIKALDASQKAVEMLSGAGIAFTNAAGASIVGQVNLMSGDNTVTLESGSTATDIKTGSGNDLYLLKDVKETETSLFTSLNGGDGEDTLQLNNAQYILNHADAITGMEHIDLTAGSVFTVNNVDFALGDNQNDANGTGYNIDTTSTLSLNSDAALAFNSHLAGTGTVAVDASGNAFDFTSNNAADGFNGTLALTNSTFELAGLNTQALSQATLNVGEGNVTHVGSGEQNIGGLAFNGGTVSFDGVTPGQSSSEGTIHAGAMDLSGRGTVQVDTGTITNDRPLADTTLSLLEQDDAQSLIQLATSDSSVTGGAGNLTLTDSNGNIISDGVEAGISQNGEIVANGTYDYRLTGGDNDDGLYISYGLTQVELLASGDNALVLDANGKTGNAADLSARVTGSGDLAFDSAKGQTVSLSNMDNDYTGITDVRSGNLLMKNDNVLGQTGELRLAADTGFDMNGHSQTVGKLTAGADSLLNINGGSLTLEQGGTADGILTGSGTLNINGDTLTITGENSTLTAKTTIAEGARVLMNTTLGLGTGDIVAAGTLTMNKAAGVLYNSISDAGRIELTESDVALVGNNSAFTGQFAIDADSRLTAFTAENLGSAEVHNSGSLVLDSNTAWQLNNDVYGSGDVTKLGAGSITVGDNAAWTGKTDIEQGGLVLGDGTSPVTLASTEVNIATAGMLSGVGGVAGNVNNAGVLQVGTGTGDNLLFTVEGNLVNSGILATGVNGQQAGNQLVVNGNYTGNDGHLSLNTALGDDNSVTDKLVVKGDTSGTTSVSVTNAGGKGAATIDGIEVIHVDGVSDGEFIQAGRIVAGAYDYSLGRGQDENSGNWYLTSGKTNPDPQPNPDPDPDKDLRPEGGSYTANLAAANNMFVTRLHDRLGETQYIDALTGEQKVTSMWMRNVGGHNNWRDGSGQLKTQSNRYVLQLGGDIAQWSQNGLERWHLGVMAGYGNDHSNTQSSRTGYRSKGSVNGYSTGVYATWYANDASHNGAWLDSWAQYSWFDNNVKGDDLQGESYKSKGVTASLEMGYAQKMGEFAGSHGTLNEWYIQPQAQAVWMGVKANDHRESNGTRITSNGNGNVQTRLGLKTWIKSHHQMDNAKEREFQPFAELNWLHNSRDFSTTMDGVNVRQDGAKNIAEVKVGVEGQVSPRLNLWGNIGVQAGDKGYNDSAAMVGVKWNF
ncbi:autotransporter outer membrane beta-barrel domain-containing protein [Citrobacter braakii]|nr:autotransporter outer membrane beta-barrel domain-containing protein [Citrobacter braakii]